MSRRFLFDDAPDLGVRQYIEPDEDGVTIITSQNIRAALDENKRKQSVHTQAPRGDQTWGNHVASIPIVVWERLCKQNPELRNWTVDAQVWLLGKLNSGEYADLKTFDGRV